MSDFMSPEDLSRRYNGRVSLGTLERWRSQRTGPAYHKVGGAVMYAAADVLAWETRNRIRTDGGAPRSIACRRSSAQSAAEGVHSHQVVEAS